MHYENDSELETSTNCCRKIIIQSIFTNISHIEKELGQYNQDCERKRFLNSRIKYYEKMLRELTGLTTLS